jgi:hypothetical protein
MGNVHEMYNKVPVLQCKQNFTGMQYISAHIYMYISAPVLQY